MIHFLKPWFLHSRLSDPEPSRVKSSARDHEGAREREIKREDDVPLKLRMQHVLREHGLKKVLKEKKMVQYEVCYGAVSEDETSLTHTQRTSVCLGLRQDRSQS